MLTPELTTEASLCEVSIDQSHSTKSTTFSTRLRWDDKKFIFPAKDAVLRLYRTAGSKCGTYKGVLELRRLRSQYHSTFVQGKRSVSIQYMWA